jgi:4-hydroxybenzoate polyprenyltransferase
MSQKQTKPEVTGQVSDAVRGNWVDHWAPRGLRPYLRLSRADRPIGTWLLLIPCWWGLLLGILGTNSATVMDLWIFVSCAIGAFLMRGAGCTWNDITDRKFDGAVERTRSRPIPSGQVSVTQAILWMVSQSVLGAMILFTYNNNAIFLGILSLVLVAIYPFAKRFTWWPQVFLGLAFNWGALLAYVAHTGALDSTAIILYLSGIAWTLFYDTIYAHQDKEDDALIGVKSTARLFGQSTGKWLIIFGVLSTALIALAAFWATQNHSVLTRWVAIAGAPAFATHLIWQLRRLDIDAPDVLLMLFRANRDAGLIPVLFFAAAMLV